MNAIEIDRALADIVLEKQKECQGRINTVSKENKGERKALQIELGMYALCLNAGFLWNTRDGREKTLDFRYRVISGILKKYPKMNEHFHALGEEERRIFIAAAQAEIFLRDQMYHGYLTECETAKAAGDVRGGFELGIKIGALESVFAAWEAWRVSYDISPRIFEEGLRCRKSSPCSSSLPTRRGFGSSTSFFARIPMWRRSPATCR